MASNMHRWKKIVDSLSIFLEIIVKLFEEIEETEAEERPGLRWHIVQSAVHD